MPALLTACLVGLVLLLAAASRHLVHCTRGDGSTHIELAHDADGCRPAHACGHQHGTDANRQAHQGLAAVRTVADLDPNGDPGGVPTLDCGGGCQHLALTIQLGTEPQPRFDLPDGPLAGLSPATTPPCLSPPQCAHRAPPHTGPPRPPSWLVHRASIVLQL